MLMSSGGNAATLIYGHSGYRVIKPGRFVLCAITGEAIALEDLRYWCVDRQEPYASAQVATRRLLDQA